MLKDYEMICLFSVYFNDDTFKQISNAISLLAKEWWPGGWMQLGVIVAVKLKAEFPKKYCQEVDGK